MNGMPCLLPQKPTRENAPTDAIRAKPKRNGDRFKQINDIIDRVISACDLSKTAALTLVCLWRDARNNRINVSQDYIAQRINSTQRAVRDALHDLESKELLKTIKRGCLRTGASVYELTIGEETHI